MIELSGPNLKLKYRTGFKSRHKSVTSFNGPNRHRGETNKDRKAFAMAQTEKYQRVLYINAAGKGRFVLASSMVS